MKVLETTQMTAVKGSGLCNFLPGPYKVACLILKKIL